MSVDLSKYKVYPLLSSIESVQSFDCGLPLIDDFLVKDAQHSDSEYRTQTQLLFYDGILTGFFSSQVGTLKLEPVDIPSFKSNGVLTDDDLRKEESMGDSPLDYPVVILSYFAIAQDYQYCGHGTSMMSLFLYQVMNAYRLHGLGFAGVLLDALPGAADFYKNCGFSSLHGKDSDLFDLPSYPMFIATQKILDIFAE